MEVAGYRVKKTAAVEDSSGGAYLVCETAACNAKTTFRGEANVYRVEVGYFDTQAGVSKFELRVNGDVAAKWSAGDTLPPAVKDDAANGNTAARFTVNGVRLKAGDVVEVHGVPEHGERTLLDFVEITRDPRWN